MWAICQALALLIVSIIHAILEVHGNFYGGKCVMSTVIEEITEEDIKAMRIYRGNTRESNHRYGDRSFMEILLEGSRKFNQEFAHSDEYKINLGDSK
jgi:hypothetical protein